MGWTRVKQTLTVIGFVAALFGATTVVHGLAAPSRPTEVDAGAYRPPLAAPIRAALRRLRAGQQLEVSTTLRDDMVDVRAYDRTGLELNGCVVGPGYECEVLRSDGHGTFSGTITKPSPPTAHADLMADALIAMRPQRVDATTHMGVGRLNRTMVAPGVAAGF